MSLAIASLLSSVASCYTAYHRCWIAWWATALPAIHVEQCGKLLWRPPSLLCHPLLLLCDVPSMLSNIASYCVAHHRCCAVCHRCWVISWAVVLRTIGVKECHELLRGVPSVLSNVASYSATHHWCWTVARVVTLPTIDVEQCRPPWLPSNATCHGY
jgi:hypothetical protein